MKFLDFEAHVVVDGEDLPEYSVEYNEKTATAICWIPSQVGKSFSVTGTPLGRSDINLAADLFTDGIFARGSVFEKDLSWKPVTWSGVSTSATTSRPLMFASIELTDDDTLLNSANHKQLGEITVEFKQVEILLENAPFESPMSTLTNDPIHERFKKAMAHRINLGAEIVESPGTFCSCNDLEILCKLTFKYRSIDILRADGIAPPASMHPAIDGKGKTPQDDEGDDDKEQDPDQVGQEDKDQLKNLLINTLEAKKGTKDRPKKRDYLSAFIPGEVIDLTL